MKNLTLKNCLKLQVVAAVGLTLAACTELPTDGQQTAKIPNPLKVFTTPLKNNFRAAQQIASGQRSFTSPVSPNLAPVTLSGTAITGTQITPPQRLLTQPVMPQPNTNLRRLVTSNQATNIPIRQSINPAVQGMQVRTADGRTMILYPGQTYHGPDGRLYVYDPNTLPVVTAGY